MSPLVGGCEARGPWFELLGQPLACGRIVHHAGMHRWVATLEAAAGAVVTVTWARALPSDTLPLATGQLGVVERPSLAERTTEAW